MAIAFGGINTGLPPNLVDQLVEAERMPIKSIEEKKSFVESKLKHVNDLETKLRGITGSLKELAGTKGFTDMKVFSGDPNIITGSADPSLVRNGSWNIEVVQLANKASAITNGFADKDKTEIGVGYFSFETPNGTKEVYIDGKNNTLDKVANTINNAGLGLQATVIKDSSDKDAPWRLVIAGATVGEGNEVKYPTLYFLDGDQDIYFEKERPAQNGKIKLDGFEMEVDKNKLDDLIPGVSLDIKQAAPGKEINLSVGEDTQVVSGKIKTFVEAMNDVLSYIQSQSRLTEKSDTRGNLMGDGLIRRLQNDIRQMLQTPQYAVEGKIKNLAELGIAFSREGTLDFNEEKFNKILIGQVDDVRSFFVGDGFGTGFINSVKGFIDRTVSNAFSPVANKKTGLVQQIRQADQKIENLERNLLIKEKNLRRKFATLEETMSKLKSQGDQMAAKMGGPGAGALNFGGMSQTGS